MIGYAEMSSRLPRGRFCNGGVTLATGGAIGHVDACTGPGTERIGTAAGRRLPVGETLNAPSEVLEIMALPGCPAMMKIPLMSCRTGRTSSPKAAT